MFSADLDPNLLDSVVEALVLARYLSNEKVVNYVCKNIGRFVQKHENRMSELIMYLQAAKIRIPEFKDEIDGALLRLIERHDEHMKKQ